MKFIDKFLNDITMYSLLMWGLLALAGVSMVMSLLGINDLPAIDQLGSLLVVVPLTVMATLVLAKFFGATFNYGSAIITGLIVYFIFDPAASIDEYLLLSLAALMAAASKFLIAPNKRHLLNPAAAAAAILALLNVEFAVWWVARSELTIPMLLLGVLVLRKLHRFTMFFAFFAASLLLGYILSYDLSIGTVISGSFGFDNLWTGFEASLTVWPTLFLGTIMLTEPITTPPHRRLQIAYGIVVGLLLTSGLSVGSIYMTPELALIIANVAFYFAFLQRRVTLKLQKRSEVADSIYEFSFEPDKHFGFIPGEYLEVTAPLNDYDSRGNRRSFSIASAPQEKDVKFGIKVPEHPSKFKQYMMRMKPGDELYVNHRQGDFTLPNKSGSYVFIAGGIGVTPFRSMITDLSLKKNDKNDIVMFYQASSDRQLAYRELFDSAQSKKANIKTVYVISSGDPPAKWSGETGLIDGAMLKRNVPDYKDRTYYISGPNVMVSAYTAMLRKAGIPRRRIKRDYFSGY